MYGNIDLFNNLIKIKAAIYTRVSTRIQATKGYGLEGQERICRQMCGIKNYEIVEIYSDRGISGTSKAHDRDSFNKLLTDAKNKKFEILVFYAFDRLARSLRVFLSIIDELSDLGIKIVSCKENVDTTTDSGDFMMNIYASISQLELKTIKTRMAMGRKEKKIKDGYLGGTLPYGYCMLDGNITVDQYQGNMIKWVYEMYYINKLAMKKISSIMNEHKVKRIRNAKMWDAKNISNILVNNKKYEGGIINNNHNNVRWPTILINKYPEKKKRKYTKNKNKNNSDDQSEETKETKKT